MINDLTVISFFQLLNRDLSVKEFEAWIYDNEKRLEIELPANLYLDLLSFDYNKKDSLAELEQKITPYIDSRDFNIWRTRMLLLKILNAEVDLVLATRKLRDLYNSTEEKLLSIELGIGYESVLDDLPVPSEYDLWNKDELTMKLKKLDFYKEDLLRDVKSALTTLERK